VGYKDRVDRVGRGILWEGKCFTNKCQYFLMLIHIHALIIYILMNNGEHNY